MKYLEDLYGEPVHQLFEVPGIGHNATGMFMSPIGLKVVCEIMIAPRHYGGHAQW